MKDADRQETTYLFDAQDRRIGQKSVTKDKDGKVINTREYTELYDKRGIYLGDESTETFYNSDGSVSEVYKSSFNADTETAEYVTTNGKGRVLYRSSEVYDKVDGRQLGRTRTESNYSEFTGNLMTTTTTKTKSESTGVFAESQRGVRADGQASHESDLSYMFVEGYGFLNYRNVYKDYLYRADGTLKYTIAGNRLMDNFYLDLFANDYWDADYLARYKFTEEFETMTAASGILAREHHLINNYEQGIDSQEYSVETKLYDEKTGALKSITTETLDYDPDLQKTVTRAVTVNAQGALIGESTKAYEYDVNDQWKNLGSTRTAFLSDGRQIIAYNDDGAGNSERTSKTYSASTGGLLMSSVSKSNDDSYTSETLSYNAAGQVIRREVVSNGADGVTTTDAYDATGVFLSRSVSKSTVGADGSRTYRMDEVDTQGRAISTEWFYPAGGNSRIRTSEFYDQDGKYHKEITTYDETGASRTTDANGTLLSYGVLTDKGDLNEFFANGKPKTAIARDDDDELRVTSFDKDGYINYVSIDHPDRPYTMYYDGNGKVAEIFYQEASGRTAYYNAADKQWYSGTGVDKDAIDVPDFAAGIDMSDIETGGRARPRGSWYPNNTVCTFGIHLRDIKPELTSKWYTVTPIDLSRDGTQSFEMIGGNMWIIGQVNVTVEGDNVTVSYDIIKDGVGRTTVKSEYFNIFADLNAITEDALEGDSKDGKGYIYGEPISIEKDLGGDTNVLLYVRNVATFNTRVYGERYLVRMWENLPERRERRADMEKLMDMDLAPAAEASGN
ncbi:MAG: RHS repeat protein [Clostridiales bacterium]|nr:RHS repeat protein [Clostridiales bacterium]